MNNVVVLDFKETYCPVVENCWGMISSQWVAIFKTGNGESGNGNGESESTIQNGATSDECYENKVLDRRKTTTKFYLYKRFS